MDLWSKKDQRDTTGINLCGKYEVQTKLAIDFAYFTTFVHEMGNYGRRRRRNENNGTQW